MNPINLVDYATHSQKIPTKFLHVQVKKTEVRSWKILLSHLIDFYFILGVTCCMILFF
jgi:hypothetical protein